MAPLIYTIATAFISTFLAVILVKPLACSLGLVDKPGGRKQHQGLIPLIGGICVYIGVTAAVLLTIQQTDFVRFFLLGAGMIVVLGALDDRYDISPRIKLFIQVLITLIFSYGLKLTLNNLGNLFGLGDIPLGPFSEVLTIIFVVGVINAMNMLDGIDGLVGGVAALSFTGFSALFAVHGDLVSAALAAAMASALLAFLVFNIYGRTAQGALFKIFMGDAGSMFIGLSLTLLLILGSQPGLPTAPSFSFIHGAWFILLPCTDMATTVFRRLRRGRSPMLADRTHIHHVLLRAGLSRKSALGGLLALQSVLVATGFTLALLSAPEILSAFLLISFLAAYQFAMARCWRLVRWSKRRFMNCSRLKAA